MPSVVFPGTYTYVFKASCYKERFIAVVYLNVFQRIRAFQPPGQIFDVNVCFGQRGHFKLFLPNAGTGCGGCVCPCPRDQ